MTATLRHLVAVLLFAASAAPALAGSFTIDRAPIADKLAPPEACGYDRARSALHSFGMTFLADVPRTPGSYRFIVAWKGQNWGATVGTSDCKIAEIPKPELRHPWCEYMPGIRIQCPMVMAE